MISDQSTKRSLQLIMPFAGGAGTRVLCWCRCFRAARSPHAAPHGAPGTQLFGIISDFALESNFGPADGSRRGRRRQRNETVGIIKYQNMAVWVQRCSGVDKTQETAGTAPRRRTSTRISDLTVCVKIVVVVTAEPVNV